MSETEALEKVDSGIDPQNLEISEMDRYQMALAQQHEQTVHGSRCDDYTPTTADKGDHVVVYCDDCGVVIHRKSREGGFREDREGSDD